MKPGGGAVRLVQCEAQRVIAAASKQSVSFGHHPAPTPVAPDCELAQDALAPRRPFEISLHLPRLIARPYAAARSASAARKVPIMISTRTGKHRTDLQSSSRTGFCPLRNKSFHPGLVWPGGLGGPFLSRPAEIHKYHVHALLTHTGSVMH